MNICLSFSTRKFAQKLSKEFLFLLARHVTTTVSIYIKIKIWMVMKITERSRDEAKEGNYNIVKCFVLALSQFKLLFRLTYTTLQNKRMWWCAPSLPPPIIFERLKLPQQIIYRRKGNLWESPNRFKYWENILILRFYEQFL